MSKLNCFIVENTETGYCRFFYFETETYTKSRDAAFRVANRNQTQKIPTTVYMSYAEKIWEYYPEPNLEYEPETEQKPENVQKLNSKPEPKPADFPNF